MVALIEFNDTPLIFVRGNACLGKESSKKRSVIIGNSLSTYRYVLYKNRQSMKIELFLRMKSERNRVGERKD